MEFIVGVDDADSETTGAKESKYLFNTIDDVVGSPLIRDAFCCFLPLTDFVEYLDCLKFNIGGLHEEVKRTLAILEINVYVFCRVCFQNDRWYRHSFDGSVGINGGLY